MAALTVDFRKHSGPTPADDMAAQIITDCGNFTLDFKQHGFCASPLFLQTLGPWFPNEMQNVLSSEKRTLDHWATVQFFFSTAQVRCFWRCLWFRRGLVALFLKTSERGDSWLQLQSTPCEALPIVWISFAWLYSQACSHPCCLCTFSYPNSSFQSTLHLICFNTAFCKQPHLSVMTLSDLVNCWPSGKYVHLLYMYSILGRGSFCFNYCLNLAWHGGDQSVALLRWYGRPGFFDSSLQLICIVGSGVSHLPLDNTPYILYGRGHQVRSWRAGVPAEFSSNPNQTHLKQLIKVLTGILETSSQVCWGKLELNSAGHRPSRIKFDDPCSMGFRSGEFAGQSSTVTPWSLNQLLVPLAVWAGAKSCWKIKSASP